MIEWFHKLASDPAAFSVVASWFGAFASVCGALIAYFAVSKTAHTTAMVASRSVYINSVTAERSKWIDALRRSIAEYSGAAERILSRRSDTKYVDSTEWATDVQLLRTHLSTLKLRLNPREPMARYLIDAARKLDQAARIHRWADVDLASEVMVRHGQWVLKFEWHRVKMEAASEAERKNLKKAEAEMNKDYAAFLENDGSLHRLDAIGSAKSELDITLLRSEMDVEVPAVVPKKRT